MPWRERDAIIAEATTPQLLELSDSQIDFFVCGRLAKKAREKDDLSLFQHLFNVAMRKEYDQINLEDFSYFCLKAASAGDFSLADAGLTLVPGRLTHFKARITQAVLEVAVKTENPDLFNRALMKGARPSRLSAETQTSKKAFLDAHPEECPICMEPILVSAESALCCDRHPFHTGCLIGALRSASRCPVCREEAPTLDAAVRLAHHDGSDEGQGRAAVHLSTMVGDLPTSEIVRIAADLIGNISSGNRARSIDVLLSELVCRGSDIDPLFLKKAVWSYLHGNPQGLPVIELLVNKFNLDPAVDHGVLLLAAVVSGSDDLTDFLKSKGVVMHRSYFGKFRDSWKLAKYLIQGQGVRDLPLKKAILRAAKDGNYKFIMLARSLGSSIDFLAGGVYSPATCGYLVGEGIACYDPSQALQHARTVHMHDGGYSIMIKGLDGSYIRLMTTPDTKIGPIKAALRDAGFSADRLNFAGKQLEDGTSLNDYKIQSGSTLHVVMRLGGEPPLHRVLFG
jgi:hypothetical protein